MALYAGTIFLSAFLLFLVQPIIAKTILPWFGGTAAVWTTCMLFFQTALLGGYLYSHWSIRRLASRAQVTLHLVLLALSLLALPVSPNESWKPAGTDNPTIRILLLLLATVGPPYLMLSATAPLIQSWFAGAFRGKSPYRLFALSNAGSMLALLGYPFAVEPFLPTRAQSWVWSGVYVAFALLCGATAWRSRHIATAVSNEPKTEDIGRTTLSEVFLWTAFPACASVLLLSITNFLTQDVAPIPFLWVLPLAIYLLSFILTFESAGWYRRIWYLPLTGAALGAMTYVVTTGADLSIAQKIMLCAGGLLICCITCHGEVAMLKPHPARLTFFYLMISVGGALGGLFVGVIAPYLFPVHLEFPIAVIGCAALVLWVHFRDPDSLLHRTSGAWGWTVATALAMGITVSFIWNYEQLFRDYQVLQRNFYGGLRIRDEGVAGAFDQIRRLTHGVINHGEQWLHRDRTRTPTSYFGPGTGIAKAIQEKDRAGPQRIGITGLGAGVMLTYARSGDYYRIYEINPLVIDLARRYFTFVQECPAEVQIVPGDARLSLERDPPQNFDVMHMDAFSSDSVPVHLLTREAFELYFRHLKPDGVLVMHISNRYLNLQPVVARAAEALGKHARMIEDYGDTEGGYFGTDMVVISADPKFFDRQLFMGYPPPKTQPNVRLWTDDYSNLFRVLK